LQQALIYSNEDFETIFKNEYSQSLPN
jgi:hypothetical protein